MPTTERPHISHAVLWHGRSVAQTDALVTELTGLARIAPADVRTAIGSQLTVKELAELRRFAYQSPTISPKKLLLISDIDRLSIPVANALLKLIEEPPRHLLIRLSATTLTAVLPTIRSRCQLVFVGSAPIADDRFPLTEVDQRSVTEQFALAESLSRDDQLDAIVVSWLRDLEAQLLRGDPVAARIRATLTLQRRLQTNANRRLALEAWLLSKSG